MVLASFRGGCEGALLGCGDACACLISAVAWTTHLVWRFCAVCTLHHLKPHPCVDDFSYLTEEACCCVELLGGAALPAWGHLSCMPCVFHFQPCLLHAIFLTQGFTHLSKSGKHTPTPFCCGFVTLTPRAWLVLLDSVSTPPFELLQMACCCTPPWL